MDRFEPVAWWKRFLAALLSASVGTLISFMSLAAVVSNYGGANDDISELTYALYFAIAAIVGMPLGLVFCLTVRRVSGPRFWVALIAGAAIGPVSFGMFVECVRALVTQRLQGVHWSPRAWWGLALSAVVSLIASLIFLLWLRRAERPRDFVPGFPQEKFTSAD